MTIVMDGYSKYITVAFFIAVILICHYLLVNLTLAVMVCNLRKQKEDEFTDLIDRQVELTKLIEERKKNLNLALKDEKVTAKQCVQYLCKLFITFKDE